MSGAHIVKMGLISIALSDFGVIFKGQMFGNRQAGRPKCLVLPHPRPRSLQTPVAKPKLAKLSKNLIQGCGMWNLNNRKTLICFAVNFVRRLSNNKLNRLSLSILWYLNLSISLQIHVLEGISLSVWQSALKYMLCFAQLYKTS